MNDSDSAPEILPELSAAAHKINIKKLEKAPYNHTGQHPGNKLFSHLLRLMINVGKSIIFRKFESDKIPSNKGGRISVATHINGLVDPTLMIITQEKRIISLGRHDLITGPVIGWWSRRNGAQPVLRKAEVEAGLTDENFARKINDRSMLTIANCLAGGHGAVIMPEGKSHQDSKLHALRTGAARAALVSAAIAKKRGLPAPVIQPTGLHWERHYWFRTKSYVEYTNPIEIKQVFDDDQSSRLANGEWIEPPASAVNELKEEMYHKLSPLTPEAPDWETYRAWILIAHLKANYEKNPLKTLSQEVHATRHIREETKQNTHYQDLISPAKEAAEILNLNNLDSSAIDKNQQLKKTSISTFFTGLIGLLLMAATSIPVIIGSGVQSILARYMVEKSDEGLDARTTYFLLAGMFSPVIFWPFTSLVITFLSSTTSPAMPPQEVLQWNDTVLQYPFLSLQALLSFISIIFVFYISSLLFLSGYDLWTNYRNTVKISKFSKSAAGQEFNILIKKLNIQLGLLK